ncbi:MAG: type IX secretion system membrane protein PorP/SprF [Saprospiraceae bacterium]|nr:type IX secretion system membrane protein PorP/SprF [Saprospiraceae bacterium]
MKTNIIRLLSITYSVSINLWRFRHEKTKLSISTLFHLSVAVSLMSLMSLMSLPLRVAAQNEGMHTLFSFNALAVNPGVAGSREVPTVTLLGRHQWVGIKGAPSQLTLGFHSPLFTKRLGFGVVIQTRRVGIFNDQNASFSLSYSIIRAPDFAIRVGLRGSMRRLGFQFEDAEQITVLTTDRPNSANLNPRLFSNIGAGLFITYKECFIGASMPNMLTNTIGLNPFDPSATALEQPHYTIMGGITLPLSEMVTLKPSAIFRRTVNAPWNAEINNSFVFNDKVSLGLGYRFGKSNASVIGESFQTLIFLSF